MTFTVSKDQMLGVFNGKRYVFVPGGLCTECAFDISTRKCLLLDHKARPLYCLPNDRSDLRPGHWKEAP